MTLVAAGQFSVFLNSNLARETVWSLREAGTEFTFYHQDDDHSGCWQAWLALLRRMVAGIDIYYTSRGSDLLLLCEDDVIFSRGLIAYLRTNPPPAGAIANLYCTAECHRPELMKWHRQPVPMRAQGSLALLIPLAIAKQIIASPPFPDRRDGTDHNLGTFCRERDIPFVTHSPSLVLHAKLETSLAAERGRAELRQAFVFAEAIHVCKAAESADLPGPLADYPEIGHLFAGWLARKLADSDPSRRRLPDHPHTLAVYQSPGA